MARHDAVRIICTVITLLTLLPGPATAAEEAIDIPRSDGQPVPAGSSRRPRLAARRSR